MKLNYKCLEASDEWGSPVEFSIHKEKEKQLQEKITKAFGYNV